MRGALQQAIKEKVKEELSHRRKLHRWSKQRMAEELMMDERSYYDLELGTYLCNTVTFVLLVRLSGVPTVGILSDLVAIADKEFVLT